MNVPDFCLPRVVGTGPSLRDGVSIQHDFREPRLKAHADAVVSCLGGRKKAVPLSPHRILARGLLGDVFRLQVNGGYVAGGENGRLSAKYLPSSKLQLEAGLPFARGERRRGNCVAIVAQELRPRDKVDLRLRKFRLKALQHRNRVRRNSVVVSE